MQNYIRLQQLLMKRKSLANSMSYDSISICCCVSLLSLVSHIFFTLFLCISTLCRKMVENKMTSSKLFQGSNCSPKSEMFMSPSPILVTKRRRPRRGRKHHVEGTSNTPKKNGTPLSHNKVTKRSPVKKGSLRLKLSMKKEKVLMPTTTSNKNNKNKKTSLVQKQVGKDHETKKRSSTNNKHRPNTKRTFSRLTKKMKKNQH